MDAATPDVVESIDEGMLVAAEAADTLLMMHIDRARAQVLYDLPAELRSTSIPEIRQAAAGLVYMAANTESAVRTYSAVECQWEASMQQLAVECATLHARLAAVASAIEADISAPRAVCCAMSAAAITLRNTLAASDTLLAEIAASAAPAARTLAPSMLGIHRNICTYIPTLNALRLKYDMYIANRVLA
jgi:hypothetical protein